MQVARRRTRPRRRPPGIDIRPGSVKAARLEAGLSLAQVAGSKVTRAAIFLIETGRARPSKRTLSLIVSRTGKPQSFFLDPDGDPDAQTKARSVTDPRLSGIEMLIASGKVQAALPKARRLLADVGGDNQQLRARVQLRLAQAQLETGNAPDALPNLRAVRDLLAAAGDTDLLAECMDALGLALKRLEDPDAMAAFNEALRLCRQAASVRQDLEARILGHIGAAYTSTHDWDAAVRHYELALNAAGNIRDLSLLERMYNDIGVAEMEAGHLTEAFGYFQKAVALAEVAAEPTIVARLENNIGSVLVGLAEFGAAETHLRRSLEICNRIHLDVGVGHVYCSLAELAIARGDLSAAEVHINAALTLTARLGEKLTEALAHQLAGQVAEMRHDTIAADIAFERALGLLAEQNSSQRLIECHVAYAAILEGRGNLEAALEHVRMALQFARPHLQIGASWGLPASAAALQDR